LTTNQKVAGSSPAEHALLFPANAGMNPYSRHSNRIDARSDKRSFPVKSPWRSRREPQVIAKVPARLNILTLEVRDLPRVRRFYEALGWESLSEGEEFARFQTGGATLALFSLGLLAAEANMQPSEDSGRFSCASRWHASGAGVRATSPTPRATSGSWRGCREPPSTSGAG
jgi:hypothetical protein